MKVISTSGAFLISLSVCFAADPPSSTNCDAVLREKLFQRFVKEMEQSSHYETHDQAYTNSMRFLFNHFIVDPTFGLRWDEVPEPTLTNSSSMKSVRKFIKRYGWNMATNDIFGDLAWITHETNKMKPIRGLPWQVIQHREFRAVTCKGVFYVLFEGWHHNLRGVAYNPNTNVFASQIAAFKPIGQHWYVWATSDTPDTGPQVYEGNKP
jgi:hypothetical protein